MKKSRQGLARQSVDEIHVDGTEARRAAGVDGAQCLLDGLLAIDRQLHRSIEVLHAEAGAIEAHGGVRRDVAIANTAWIEFDGKIAGSRTREMEETPEAVDQAPKSGRIQKVRRPAAEVQLHHIAIAIEQRRHHLRLAHQAFGVRRTSAHVARDDSIASTVEARRETEWHVHVQRQVARNRLLVAARHLPPEVGVGEARGKLRRRRIRGVSLTGPVVAAQQIEIEVQACIHGRQPGLPSARGLHRMGAYTTTNRPKLNIHASPARDTVSR